MMCVCVCVCVCVLLSDVCMCTNLPGGVPVRS